ncbi:MAG: aminotransferase class V-fold PLP-dependent enzyme [Candidatus Nanoarchaeia archaeon]|nr:aminotransferase class V-fold PLP-dependent enzyme [Candidatus Nanoarchaeia archaeon]
MATINDFLDDKGFIDIPSVIKSGEAHNLFPGYHPDIEQIRSKDFPLFGERVYLDNGATSQVPDTVKDKIHNYRKTHIRGSNHSNENKEAEQANLMFESARKELSDFFGASNYLMAFTSGTTGSSNMIGASFDFQSNDLLLLTEMEHNSQILTPRNFAKMNGAKVDFVPVELSEGRLDLNYLKKVVDEFNGGKILLNVVHVSNVTGVINPIKEIRQIIGDKGAIYLDMAHSAGHVPTVINELDVDFFGMSAHKMNGPFGIGLLGVKKGSQKYLNSNRISGGGAIDMVTIEGEVISDGVARFEPGTQNLEGAIEWMFTAQYLKGIGGIKAIRNHDEALGSYFLGELEKINNLYAGGDGPKITIYGPKTMKDKVAIFALNIGERPLLHNNNKKVARILDKEGIAVRPECFCAHIYLGTLNGFTREIREERLRLVQDKTLPLSEMALLGAVRFGVGINNNLMDMYRAVEAVKEIAADPEIAKPDPTRIKYLKKASLA